MAFYGTVADADAYHLARGNTAWAGTNPQKEAALTRGSDYVDLRYRWMTSCGHWESMFPGQRTGGRAQEREWPRTGAVDYSGNPIPDDEVPIEVEHATYEAALRELVSPGSLSPDFIPGGQVTKEKVGPVEVQYAEAKWNPNATPNRPIVPVIDEILAPLTYRTGCAPAVFVV